MTHVSLLAFFLCSGNCVALLQRTNQLRRSRVRFAKKKKPQNFQLVTAVLKTTGKCVGRALLGVGWGGGWWGGLGGVFCQRLIGCFCYPGRKKKTLKYSFFFVLFVILIDLNAFRASLCHSNINLFTHWGIWAFPPCGPSVGRAESLTGRRRFFFFFLCDSLDSHRCNSMLLTNAAALLKRL